MGDHERHGITRAAIAADRPVSAIAVAETFSQLRRTAGFSAAVSVRLLEPWIRSGRLLPTAKRAVARTLGRAVELDLGGSVHDALIAAVHAEAGVPLVTLDARQHQLAIALGADSTYLLA